MAASRTDRIYDELLVTLAQAGDRRAGERLASRWHPRLLRTARRLLGDADQAQDAAQEAWLGVVRGLDGLLDPAAFPGWAFGILHRKCADRIRQEQRRRIEPVLPVAAEAGPDDAVTIRNALAALSEDHRAVAILHFAEGLTLAEVATATGIPLGTAKSRLFHARRQLKAALTGEEP